MTEKLRDRQRDTMTINTLPNGTTVTELGQFLKNPPEGFTVKAVGSAYQVQCGEENLVFIDKFHSGDFDVVFQNSLGRKLKMHNLWEYTSMRKSLLSKRIYVLVSLCDQSMQETSKKGPIKPRALQEYVLSVNGGNPMMKWQMEKGLDWTISSVGGESYRVEIDLSEILQSLAAEGLIAENLMKYNPTWKDASFTLKYYSDALFDFPHWLGRSKRSFQLRLMRNR
ncbi:mesenteric estrogen-dependent adipogenesis protein [Xiphophorus hellerii]|uniref:mesenteric estrogen-dependent adipogenesis protein n=1 Tax=Xiphophorus hellerii TaxID=8084 RepID=UPI0013B3FC5A|nr:mesenteric estrogen-dependent adipogenesis protein [Xiphophorus hellerii]